MEGGSLSEILEQFGIILTLTFIVETFKELVPLLFPLVFMA